MNFIEAINEVRKLRRVYRKSWIFKDIYLQELYRVDGKSF